MVKAIRILFYYILGIIGILFVSIVPTVIASGNIYNIPVYLQKFYEFVKVFLKSENWIYYYKNEPMPIIGFLKEPYIYSAKIFISAILIGFVIALLLAFLTFLLPAYVMNPVKRILSILEAMPDLLVAVLLQLSIVFIFKKTNILLFKFAVVGEETIYMAPILTLSILPAIFLYRLILMLAEEELSKPYTEYASAKGMGRLRILRVHIFRNIFPSIFHHSKIVIWGTMSSLYIVEYIFNTRGLTYYIGLDFKPMVLAVALLLIYTPFFILYQGGQEWLDSLEEKRSSGRVKRRFAISSSFNLRNAVHFLLKSLFSQRKIIAMVALFAGYCAVYLHNNEDPVKKMLLSASARVQAESSGDQSMLVSNSKIKKQLQPMLTAINKNDAKTFLSFQNKSNKIFYKEQKSWIRDVINLKKHGWEFSVDIGAVDVMSARRGTIELIVGLKAKESEPQNYKVTYSLIKSDKTWKLNDPPFKKKSYNTISVYYSKDVEEKADKSLMEAISLVRLYEQEFGWKPGEITIKLYPTVEELSATVPTFPADRYSRPGESIKVSVDEEQGMETTLAILADELADKMLADLTNDNASVYMEEGFGTFLKNVVQDDGNGFSFNFDFMDVTESDALRTVKIPVPIDQINTLTGKNIGKMLSSGTLLTSYLVREKGIEKFTAFAEELKKNKHIDKEGWEKAEETDALTLKAIEKVYGPLDQLSEEYRKYFISKRANSY
ncbi:ABC transporter permease subunit [Peribacillus deserti]|nr:ABC transporter permease subunit [Peribacillus deserti]